MLNIGQQKVKNNLYIICILKQVCLCEVKKLQTKFGFFVSVLQFKTQCGISKARK